jgi:hypothetical protein
MSDRRIRAIEEMGVMETARQEELRVSLDNEQAITMAVVFGLIIVFGIVLAFYADIPLLVELALLIIAVFFVRSIVSEYRKPNTRLIVNKHGIYFNGKEYYPWVEIQEIVVEDDSESSPELVLHLRYKARASFSFSLPLDHSIDTVAAYINKYWKHSQALNG